MLETLNGRTRIFAVVGDPIAQVKAPAKLTHMFSERGINAIFIPLHVRPDGLEAFFAGANAIENLDGMTITVPHKIAGLRYVAKLSDRARFLGAVNVVRRTSDRSGWMGDMVDGLGFIGALRGKGFAAAGKRALLVGAGGAGSAIAFSLLDEGIKDLAIHDIATDRRDNLIAKLRNRGIGNVLEGSAVPDGYDLVINASSMGMAAGDPLPIDTSRLAARMYVADVVPAPTITRLLEEAGKHGCRFQTGVDMFTAQTELIFDFLLGRSAK